MQKEKTGYDTNIAREGIGVTERFFQAIDMLKEKKVIRGLQTFTREYDINRWNMNSVKWEPEKRFLKTEWIVYLCRDYYVSPEWLILGKGKVFTEEPVKR